jgi:hypothetical protein
MLTKDGIHTLADVVIIYPMWTDLLLQSCVTQRFLAFNATKAKEKNYHNWQPIDQFLPLAIEVFGCLHKHADVFLHDCANSFQSLKVIKGPHLSTLIIFFCQKVSITLQRMQKYSIFSWAITVGITTFQLPPYKTHLPSPRPIYCKLSIFDI